MSAVMRFVLSLFAVLSMLGIANAQEGPVELRFLTGWWTERGTHMAAFEISLRPGWKTYWRSPGESGIPPRLGWDKAQNIARADLHWPEPSILETFGSKIVGYEGHIVLPIEISPKAPGEPVRAGGMLEIGVCKDVCVPVSLAFAADLPSEGRMDPAIRAALDAVPRQTTGDKIPGMACSVTPLPDGMQVVAKMDQSSGRRTEVAIFEHHDPEVWVSGAEILRSGGSMEIVADFVPPEAQPFALSRSEIRLTLIGDNAALEIMGCPAG